MLERLFVPAILALMALLVLALPIFPHEEPASVELRPPVENDADLLGGDDGQLEEPPAAPQQISGEPVTGAMTLSVPKLGIRNLPVPTGSTQEELDQEGVIRLQDSGRPGQTGANTFIVGHTLGFQQTAVPYVFYELESLRPGDKIVLKDNSKRYVYRVYDEMTVRPQDHWATHPVEGKTIVSLQGCTPIPTFEHRLVVRGELVSSQS